ncbi:MAG: hypothetical protein MUO72_09635 [Bacteroidales bacterium]|nr:hypothetical protein [Bacteroidales bacterium]
MKRVTNKIKDFCRITGINIDQFNGREKVGGSLYLSSLTSIPEGFNPTVGGSLYLSSLTSIPEGFNPTVGGSLDLRSLTSIPEGFNPTVGGSLDLSSLTSIPEGFNPTVGGSLYLSSLTSIPEGFNPTVGGSLYLRSLTSIPEGFNPTVGGYLYLSSLTSIPEGFNPTVGGSLYLRNLTSKKPTYKKLASGYLLSWQDGKYLLADGIFTEVISHRGNVYHVRKIASKEIICLVTDGDGKWSHGETLKEAKSDLVFKISNRTKDDYKNLKLTSILPFEEAIICYRVITGACSFGTKDFINNRLTKKQGRYTISKIIEITKGEWGHKSFIDFFNK